MANKAKCALAVRGLLSAYVTGSEVDEFVQRRSHVSLFADGAAASTVAETAIWCPQVPVNLRAVAIAPNANVASNGSNYVTITVGTRSNGGAVTNVATFTTSATSLTSFVPVVTSLVNTLPSLAATTDVVTVTLAKAGGTNATFTGGFNVTLFYEET